MHWVEVICAKYWDLFLAYHKIIIYRVEGMQTFVQRYNSENRLSNIELVGGDCEEHGITSKEWEFVYDGDGVKVKQVVTEGENVLITYYYAGGRDLCTPEPLSGKRGIKVKQVVTEGENVLITYYYAGGRDLCTPERTLREGEMWWR